MVLYADILLAINFSMDFLSLFLCSMLMHLKIKRLRILVASSLGAIYAFVQMVMSLGVAMTFLCSVAIAMLMIIIAFPHKSAMQIVTYATIYLFVSATLSGIMSLLYSLMNRVLSSFIESYSYDSAYNTARLWILISLTAIISIVFSRILLTRKDTISAEITVVIRTKKYILSGLSDSGNLLRDPLSGRCVILVSEKSEIGQEIDGVEDIHKKYIPYKDISGEGLLKGVTPKEIIINGISVKAIIATVKNKSFDGYDALIPSTLI